MTTPILEEQFEALHDQLGNVFHQSEAFKKDILSFYKTAKAYFKNLEDEWQSEEPDDKRKNFVEQEIENLFNKQMEEHLTQLNSLFADAMQYMKACADLHLVITATMQQVMDVAQQLYDDTTPAEAVEQSIATLQTKVDGLQNDTTSSVAALPQYEDRFFAIKKDFEEWEKTKEATKTFDVFALPKEVLDKTKNEMVWDQIHFLTVSFPKWHKETTDGLTTLMYQQFPEFKEQDHPSILRYIDYTNSKIAEKVILHCYTLLTQQQEGMVPVEKYGGEKLEKWRAFYGKPEEPKYLLTDSDKEDQPEMNDEQWERYKADQNEQTIMYHEWTESRKAEWFNLLQPYNFEHLPQLLDMDGDYWLLYAVNMRDNYEDWKTWLESLHSFITYPLDPKLLDGEAKIWRNKMTEIYCNWTVEERNRHHKLWEKKWNRRLVE